MTGWRFSLLLLPGAVIALNGCATLVGVALDPKGAVDTVARDSVNSLTGVDTASLSQSSAEDIDRILREHPNTENDADLQQLKSDLKNQPGASAGAGVSSYDAGREWQTQHDRRLTVSGKRKKDQLNLESLPERLRDTPRGNRDRISIHPDHVTITEAETPQTPMIGDQPVRFGQ